MPDVLTQVLVIAALILVNAFLALAELAVVSARPSRLRQWVEEGRAGARRALELAENPNQFLSTIQTGITLVGILAGAFGGAMLAEPLAGVVERVEPLAPYSRQIALGVVVLAVTYATLVIGELVPKRLGMAYPERFAVLMAGPMHVLSLVTLPVVRLLTASTDLVLRLLRVSRSQEPPVTEEEITLLVAEGAHAGVFENAERDIVERVFRVGDQQAGDVMTPRNQVVWLDLDRPPDEHRRCIVAAPHAHVVVCRGGLDQVVGIVRSKELLVQALSGAPFDAEAVLRRPLFVPETLSALGLLDRFRRTGEQVALVVDEYGGFSGLVTLDDLLDAIVGNLPLLGAPTEPGIVHRADGSWLVDGRVPVDEFKDHFHIHRLPDEHTGAYRTAGGFVANYLGRIPAAGEHFTWRALRFEVVDMDGHRVDKLLISNTGPAAPATPGEG